MSRTPHPDLANFSVVDGFVKCSDTFQVERYGDLKTLADPTFKPTFVCRVPNGNGLPLDWFVIVIPGKPDVFYRSDPRTTDLHRNWPLGSKFPTFMPVYKIEIIGRNNRLARYARAMVHKWMMEKFTFLRIEASPKMEHAGSSVS